MGSSLTKEDLGIHNFYGVDLHGATIGFSFLMFVIMGIIMICCCIGSKRCSNTFACAHATDANACYISPSSTAKCHPVWTATCAMASTRDIVQTIGNDQGNCGYAQPQAYGPKGPNSSLKTFHPFAVLL